MRKSKMPSVLAASAAQPSSGPASGRTTPMPEAADDPSLTRAPSPFAAASEDPPKPKKKAKKIHQSHGLMQPRPPAGGTDGDAVGNGGCAAHALHELGVGEDLKDTLERLNGRIDAEWKRLQKQRPGVAIPRVHAGVDDDRWNGTIIADVLKDADKHLVKLDDSRRANLAAELVRADTSYLIDGILNCKFTDTDGSIVETDPTDKGPRPWEAGGAASWRHAVAVVDGSIKEQHDQEYDVGVLHLDERGLPDNRRGYFWSVAKVYEVVHCCGDGCSTCAALV